MGHGARAQQVHLVTQARRPMSEDIRYRQHRYLIMMGIRTLCFAIAIVLFVAHLRLLVLIPAVGAIIIPYIAVIFANGGREPDNTRGFLEHRSRLSAPSMSSALARRDPARPGGPSGTVGGTGSTGTTGGAGTGGGAGDFSGSGAGFGGSGSVPGGDES
jgi:uncharacterized membrane protein YgcG